MAYKVFKISDSISLIQETYVANFMRCNIWHVQGEKFDLIIDTGMGLSPLKDWVIQQTDKTVKAIITHSHFDHCGSLHEFDCRLGHPEEASIINTALNEQIVFSGAWKEVEIIDKNQFPNYSGESFQVTPAPLTGFLDEGDVIDLGNKAYQVLHLPGHSPGSIGLFDVKSKILFSGDAIYDGELLDNFYHSDKIKYKETLLRLRELDVCIFHGGHFPSFSKERANEIIDGYFLGSKKIKNVMYWYKKIKKLKNNNFSDQDWSLAKKLISQNEK